MSKLLKMMNEFDDLEALSKEQNNIARRLRYANKEAEELNRLGSKTWRGAITTFAAYWKSAFLIASFGGIVSALANKGFTALLEFLI
jgi:hypothetical protein